MNLYVFIHSYVCLLFQYMSKEIFQVLFLSHVWNIIEMFHSRWFTFKHLWAALSFLRDKLCLLRIRFSVNDTKNKSYILKPLITVMWWYSAQNIGLVSCSHTCLNIWRKPCLGKGISSCISFSEVIWSGATVFIEVIIWNHWNVHDLFLWDLLILFILKKFLPSSPIFFITAVTYVSCYHVCILLWIWHAERRSIPLTQMKSEEFKTWRPWLLPQLMSLFSGV